jgi:hypothetical protein
MNSKLKYVAFHECEKKYYLLNKHPELYNASIETQMLIKKGKDVEAIARKSFDGGTIARVDDSIADSIARTKKLIDQGCELLYEATFAWKNFVIVVDILRKTENGWQILEVKSGSSATMFGFIKDGKKPAIIKSYLRDIAIQKYVLDRNGINTRPYIMCVNTKYKLEGELNPQKYFVTFLIEDPKIKEFLEEIDDTLPLIDKVDKLSSEPDKIVGTHCRNPYSCPFRDHCWKDIKKNSIHNIARITQKKRETLIKANIQTIEDFQVHPEQMELLSQDQVIAVKGVLNKRIKKDKMKLNMLFLNRLKFPIYHLDFEAFMPIVPKYQGTRSSETIPTQYSIHVEQRNGDLEHREFIHDRKTDPRLVLLKNLIEDLDSSGSILVYNANFEISVLKLLAEWYPDYNDKIEKIIMRIVDLMIPFRDGLYYHPDMYFSYSLKWVLPALVPSLTYEGLNIKNGEEAMLKYEELINLEDGEKKESLKKDLLEYCKLDTLAMVEILKVLRK